MSQQEMVAEFLSLPPGRQRLAADYIAFLKSVSKLGITGEIPGPGDPMKDSCVGMRPVGTQRQTRRMVA